MTRYFCKSLAWQGNCWGNRRRQNWMVDHNKQYKHQRKKKKRGEKKHFWSDSAIDKTEILNKSLSWILRALGLSLRMKLVECNKTKGKKIIIQQEVPQTAASWHSYVYPLLLLSLNILHFLIFFVSFYFLSLQYKILVIKLLYLQQLDTNMWSSLG